MGPGKGTATNSTTASKKKTNSKKKKNANKNKGTAQPVNGDVELGTNDTGENEPEPPTQAVSSPAMSLSARAQIVNAHQSQDIPADDAMTDAGDERVDEVTSSNGHAVIPEKTTAEQSSDMEPATAKLDAMSKEREALRAEVEQLRRQLENIQQSHNEEVAQLQTNLDQTTSAKEEAEEQYQNLRERVEKIRESLTDRLQRDKAELDEAKERIEELTAENEELRGSKQSSGEDVEKLRQELQDATRELNTLRSRSNLSTQNWTREKDELTRTIQHLREEMVQASNAMGEWEVIAMEERSLKESLSDKIQELEEQVLTLKRNYENAAMERDSQATLVDNLQNALKEIQEARKKELREMVETTEAQLQAHKQAAQVADSRAAEAEAAKEVLAKEVERTAPFEKEVKEKNLLIGKLRHEAIVLNEHLTKALRYLKKTKPEDNVDRYGSAMSLATTSARAPC